MPVFELGKSNFSTDGVAMVEVMRKKSSRKNMMSLSE
jgi:hypothetical protein